jgi:hypothetical protein
MPAISRACSETNQNADGKSMFTKKVDNKASINSTYQAKLTQFASQQSWFDFTGHLETGKLSAAGVEPKVKTDIVRIER